MKFLINLIVICALLVPIVGSTSCSLLGGGSRSTPVNGITPSKNVSKTDAGLLGNLKNDLTNGDKKAAKADKAVITETNTVETNTDLRWLMIAGVIILALGGLATWEIGFTIGGGILALGGSLIAASMLLTALLPYELIMSLVILGLVVIGIVWRFRKQLFGSTSLCGTAGSKLAGLFKKSQPAINKVETQVSTDVKSVENDIKKTS